MSVLSVLFFTFIRIGLGAFGGGLATIPFIHHELVVSHAWLTEREFAEVVSLAQMTPGPVAVNAATYVGYRLAGFAGSLTATIAVVAAPLALVSAAAWLLSGASGRTKAWAERVQRALRPVVAAMLSARSGWWSAPDERLETVAFHSCLFRDFAVFSLQKISPAASCCRRTAGTILL